MMENENISLQEEKNHSKISSLATLPKFIYLFSFTMLIMEIFYTTIFMVIKLDWNIYFPLFLGGIFLISLSLREMLSKKRVPSIKKFGLFGVFGAILVLFSNIIIRTMNSILIDTNLLLYLDISRFWAIIALITNILITILAFINSPNVLKDVHIKSFIKFNKISYVIFIIIEFIFLIYTIDFIKEYVNVTSSNYFEGPYMLYVIIIFTIIIPIILQIVSAIFLLINPYYLKRVIILGGNGAFLFIIYLLIRKNILYTQFHYYYRTSSLLIIFTCEMGILIINILLQHYKKEIILEKVEEVRNVILESSTIYNKMSLKQIFSSIPKLHQKSYPFLKSIVKEMISKNEIEAELTGDILLFKREIPELISVPSGDLQAEGFRKDFDFKMRLFGMIKTRKNINIKQAAEFLKVSPDLIEGLIYDLVGEGKVEGRFKDDVFIFESDIDQFISILDESYKSWESQDKMKNKID